MKPALAATLALGWSLLKFSQFQNEYDECYVANLADVNVSNGVYCVGRRALTLQLGSGSRVEAIAMACTRRD
jgi:hypothetical protein